jgi:uncharacterized membrane protein YfcA
LLNYRNQWKHYYFTLCCCFAAGFIDAIVGGGLIQTPAGLILLPNLPVSTVIGTCFQRNFICGLPVPEKGNDGLEIIT